MSYTVSQLDSQSQRTSLLDLWQRNLPTASAARYSWLYEKGPATSWLLRSETGDTVGSTGLLPRTMKVFDDLLPAGQAVDLNVDEDHRTVGPALGLQRAVTATVKQQQLSLVYGLPNSRSEPLMRRAGYKVLGSVSRWIKLLSCEKALEGRLRCGLARRVVAPVVDSLSGLASLKVFQRRPAGAYTQIADHFDSRFDALWQTASPRFSIVGERKAAYLDWRFRQCPDAVYRVFSLLGARHELRAYVVYCRHKGTVYVNDLLFADTQSLKLLLADFLGLMRRHEAEAIVVVYFGSSTLGRVLSGFGFLKRPSDWKVLAYVDQQRLGPNLTPLMDQENWYLTRADVDTDFQPSSIIQPASR